MLPAPVQMQWGVKIPLRDGIYLNATLYILPGRNTPMPCVMTLTPYIGQMWHQFAVYFAAHGYPFLTVDCRGRGNSEGIFAPFIHEAFDGYDAVEWVAHQPYCNGQVAMWGGSYGGFDQWATAAECPPHLATIVPVASVAPGHDFPLRNNVASPYMMQWLTLVSGRTSQERMFFEAPEFWSSQFRDWFEGGTPFRGLDAFLGNPSEIFQEWICHPKQGQYWDSRNPASRKLGKLSVPVLTITGIYDSDQPGALMYYRQHLADTSIEARSHHYLVIGPWDHSCTRVARAEFGGLKVGPASVIDLPKLHLQWYAWTMQGGLKPPFLKKNVAYYVTGVEKWRYADTLDAITARLEPLYLQSSGSPVDVFHSGTLVGDLPIECEPDQYVYDPHDIESAELESMIDPYNLTDQRLVFAKTGKQLIYHSAPFERDTEITGFFRLHVWLSIDRPDTDFRVAVYVIDLDGSSILLCADWLRARYRVSLREERLINTSEPLPYKFERFTFISRRIRRGQRLRLVIGPINSIYSQKNYNSGGVVAEESVHDARPVTVVLYHDQAHPSALYVPYAVPESSDEVEASICVNDILATEAK